ncbi:Uncharacterised protein [Mycobacteroides abscessus subsp. abscessus]|nr:Uncharacterised protein [Mycobacteroides abscessus subsp. abscessus]
MIFGGPLPGGLLGERIAGGCRHHQKRFRCADLIQRIAPDRRLHHHAGPTTVWRVIDGLMHVVCPAPQIMHHDIDQTSVNSLARQGLPHRLQIFREDRDDVYFHDGILTTDPAALPEGQSR